MFSCIATTLLRNPSWFGILGLAKRASSDLFLLHSTSQPGSLFFQTRQPYATQMKAVIVPKAGISADEMEVGDLPVPEPNHNQVRVRVAACGVCFRDILDRQVAFPFMKLPAVLGHEIAGVVDKVGSHVTDKVLGDRVVSLHWNNCGACDPCKQGDTTGCSVAW